MRFAYRGYSEAGAWGGPDKATPHPGGELRQITCRETDKQYQPHIVIIHKRLKTGVAIAIHNQLLLINKQRTRNNNRP